MTQFMSSRILCVIDFSESTEETLRYSAMLAQKLNNPLTILYAYRLLQSWDGEAVETKNKIETEALNKFHAIEKDIQRSGVPYDFKMEIGFADDRIKDFTKKNKLSFLVVDKNLNDSYSNSLREIIEKNKKPLVVVP